PPKNYNCHYTNMLRLAVLYTDDPLTVLVTVLNYKRKTTSLSRQLLACCPEPKRPTLTCRRRARDELCACSSPPGGTELVSASRNDLPAFPARCPCTRAESPALAPQAYRYRWECDRPTESA